MSPTEAQAPGRRQMAVSDLGQVVQRRDAPLGQPIPPRLDTLEPAIDVAEHDPPGVGRPRAVDALQHQFQREAQLQLGDDDDRGLCAAHRDDVAAADLPLRLEALPLQERLNNASQRLTTPHGRGAPPWRRPAYSQARRSTREKDHAFADPVWLPHRLYRRGCRDPGSRGAGRAPERAYAKLVHYNRLDTGYDKYRRDFSKFVWQTASPKIGHNLAQEAPQAFAQAAVDVDQF